MQAVRFREEEQTSFAFTFEECVRGPEPSVRIVKSEEQLVDLGTNEKVAYLKGERYVRSENHDGTVGPFVHETAKVSPRVNMDDKALVCARATVHDGVSVTGRVRIGEGADIGRGAVIYRSIAPNKVVPANATVPK